MRKVPVLGHEGCALLGKDFYLENGEHICEIIDLSDNLDEQKTQFFYLFNESRFFIWPCWIYSDFVKTRKTAQKVLTQLGIKFLEHKDYYSASCEHLIGKYIKIEVLNHEVINAMICLSIPECDIEIKLVR